MKSRYIIFLILLLIPLSISAQSKKKNDKRTNYTRHRTTLEPLPISIAAVGGLKQYGLKLAIDYPIRKLELRGFRGGTTGYSAFVEHYISFNVGMLHHDAANENFFANAEWSVRFINGSGVFYQLTPLGLGGNYVINPLFSIKDNMPLDTTLTTGRFYATPSVSFALGRDFSVLRAHKYRPFVVYAKATMATMWPLKKWYGYLLPTVEAGFAFKFPFLNTAVRKTRRD
jgi:hypothetical protein